MYPTPTPTPSPPGPPSRPVPPACRDLVRHFEGCRLQAYKPTPLDVWTIGYGHTGHDVHPGWTITPAEADHLLDTDLQAAGAAVLRLVRRPLTAGQYAALTSLVFNLGSHRLAGSTLIALANAGAMTAAAGEFPRWCHQGGRPLAGLVARRAAEAALFLAPDLPSDPVALAA